MMAFYKDLWIWSLDKVPINGISFPPPREGSRLLNNGVPFLSASVLSVQFRGVRFNNPLEKYLRERGNIEDLTTLCA